MLAVATAAICLSLLHIHVYVGAVMIDTGEHCADTDEDCFLQVKVQIHADAIRNNKSTGQQALVADLNKQGDGDLNEHTVITEKAHGSSPAEMLLENVKRIDEEYEQPLSQDLLDQVELFRTALESILEQLMRNRFNTLEDLNAKLAAIGTAGNPGTEFELSTFTAARGQKETEVRALKNAVDDCADPNNNPIPNEHACGLVEDFRNSVAQHECEERTGGGDGGGLYHMGANVICAQQGVPRGSDNLMQASNWDDYLDRRANYCEEYDRTPPTTLVGEYQALLDDCTTETTNNAQDLTDYQTACDTSNTNYVIEYCAWRNRWIEGCTRDLHTAYNNLVMLYINARLQWINVLDPEWDAEYITIERILCFLQVWTDRSTAEAAGIGHLHSHSTKEYCMNNYPIDPADMNTQTIGGITADLRIHLPEPTLNDLPALVTCDYSVVNEAFFGYVPPDSSGQGGTCSVFPLAPVLLWGSAGFTAPSTPPSPPTPPTPPTQNGFTSGDNLR
eukprot:gnl/TRDRNA2_/TRDRNA2_85006_c0_seq1.p1 gnl/TRDRNA2_/TRDRNA2_85006_c0~~gnl/TRDRNA2_/TRDRNA2_85006_c0_seq1.p1  ORF type:complete len:505 (-),score=29.79 gnl/TRDRNA2_/TRDRNA2_85006_c0_seq1:58-1572(-)